jgi:hypothetical protein
VFDVPDWRLTFSPVHRRKKPLPPARQQPGPWVDQRSRRVWRVVTDLSRLELHVAKLIQVLCDPARDLARLVLGS